jgi:hypothetical protein
VVPGEKRPGLEAGVLPAVFEIAVERSIVEDYQCECRHVGERASKRFVANGRNEPSARGRHCAAVTLFVVSAPVMNVVWRWWGDAMS